MLLQNKTKQNKTKQNKTKQNKTKQNKTKQNKTKQNKTTQHNTTQKTQNTHNKLPKKIINNKINRIYYVDLNYINLRNYIVYNIGI